MDGYQTPPSKSPPSTPRGVRRVSAATSPPPRPCLSKMLIAIKRKNIDEVAALIDDDPNLVSLPIKTQGHIEPPLFFALRNKCPVNILRLLLSKGASPCERGLNSLISLANLPQNAPFMPPPHGPSVSHQNLLGVSSAILPSMPSFCGMMQPLPAVSISCQLERLEMQHQRHCELPINPSKASAEYEVSVAACLLQYGADPFERDSHGISAVEHAERAGKSELADLMQNWSQWQECRLHCRMDVLALTENVSKQVYDYLLPCMWQSKLPPLERAR